MFNTLIHFYPLVPQDISATITLDPSVSETRRFQTAVQFDCYVENMILKNSL